MHSHRVAYRVVQGRELFTAWRQLAFANYHSGSHDPDRLKLSLSPTNRVVYLTFALPQFVIGSSDSPTDHHFPVSGLSTLQIAVRFPLRLAILAFFSHLSRWAYTRNFSRFHSFLETHSSLLTRFISVVSFSSYQNPIGGQRRRLPTKGHPARTFHPESSKESLRGPTHTPKYLLSLTSFVLDHGQGRPYPRQRISWFATQAGSLLRRRFVNGNAYECFICSRVNWDPLGLAPPLSVRAINLGFTSYGLYVYCSTHICMGDHPVSYWVRHNSGLVISDLEGAGARFKRKKSLLTPIGLGAKPLFLLDFIMRNLPNLISPKWGCV